MKACFRLLCFAGLLLTGLRLPAAERIPPAPPRYFNDYAGVVSPATATRLNAQLEQFERDSSNQLLVAIYPKMESDSSVEDYTVRVAQSWQVGQKGRNNGAVLFAFMASHDLYLQVGYGLEGAIPDALAKRIITKEIVPRFRAGDMDSGLTAAVNAMIAAAKGEYKGTGRTVAEKRRPTSGGSVLFMAGFLILIIVFSLIFGRRRRSPTVLINPGRLVRRPRTNIWWTGGGGGFGGGGGGGGGFSGGGGSFGGGGAGGKW